MRDQDAIQMMRVCREEIITLRKRLDVVEPKADAYNQLKTVLEMLPQSPQGYCEDIVHGLNQQIQTLESADKEETTKHTK